MTVTLKQMYLAVSIQSQRKFINITKGYNTLEHDIYYKTKTYWTKELSRKINRTLLLLLCDGEAMDKIKIIFHNTIFNIYIQPVTSLH